MKLWIGLAAEEFRQTGLLLGRLRIAQSSEKLSELGGESLFPGKTPFAFLQRLARVLKLMGLDLRCRKLAIGQRTIGVVSHGLLQIRQRLGIPAQPAQRGAEIKISLSKRRVQSNFLLKFLPG